MAKLSKDNYIKLEKAISLLESISKDITITSDMEDVITNASDVISSLSTQFSYERSKPFVLEEKHLNYLDSVREELIKAEETIDNIKHNKEWKQAIDYFSNMRTKGKLKSRPTRKNGYTYEVNENYFNQKPLNKKYVDYLNGIREELIKAENVVSKIKNSNEWRKSLTYFAQCEHRGLLESKLSKKNGYIVKAKDFSDIE